MNPLLRLAGAAIVAVLAAGVVFLAIRPSSSVGPRGTASPEPSARTSVAPATGRQLAPTAVIDLAGMVNDTIPLTTDGTDLWVGVDGAIIRIDGRTNATHRIAVPDMVTGNGAIAIASDGLWMANYGRSYVELLNPATGAVEASVNVTHPNVFYLVDGQVWVGIGASTGVVRVDQVTSTVGKRIGDSSVVAFGLGEIWAGEWDGIGGDHQASDVISRIDSATGVTVGTIPVPPGTGCTVSGSFPDNIWAGCPADFGTCPANRIAVRIDPSTNKVATTARICGYPVIVIDGTPWFLVGRKEGADNANSLVSVDPGTGQLLAQLDLGRIDPDVVVRTGDSLWMSDEQGDRIVRYALADLRT